MCCACQTLGLKIRGADEAASSPQAPLPESLADMTCEQRVVAAMLAQELQEIANLTVRTPSGCGCVHLPVMCVPVMCVCVHA